MTRFQERYARTTNDEAKGKVGDTETPVVPSNDSSFLGFATPPASVSAFSRAVIARVVPDGFWGLNEARQHNKQLMMRKIDHFISLRKFESLSLHETLQEFKVYAPSPRKKYLRKHSAAIDHRPALACATLS